MPQALILNPQADVDELMRRFLKGSGVNLISLGLAQFDAMEPGALDPQVVFVDVIIPYQTGIALVEKARTRFPRAQIFAMTSYTGEGISLRAKRAGANGFLGKPFSKGDLISIFYALDDKTRPNSPASPENERNFV